MDWPRKRHGDIIEIKIKDINRQVYFKARANLIDRRQVAQMLRDIEIYSGISIEELMQLVKVQSAKKEGEMPDWW